MSEAVAHSYSHRVSHKRADTTEREDDRPPWDCLITLKEAGELARCSTGSIRLAIKLGELRLFQPYTHETSYTRCALDREAVEEWAKRRALILLENVVYMDRIQRIRRDE